MGIQPSDKLHMSFRTREGYRHVKCDKIDVEGTGTGPKTFVCEGDQTWEASEDSVQQIKIGRPGKIKVEHRNGTEIRERPIEFNSRNPDYMNMQDVRSLRPEE